MFSHKENDTMKIIGFNSVHIITENECVRTDLNNILQAYQNKNAFHLSSIITDAFILGYMYGKRAERAKKKAQVQQVI